MADRQTLAATDPKPLEPSPMAPASPDASAASTKKKRKKKSSEEREAAAAAVDTPMADPDTSPASTKEKRKKDKKKKKSSEEGETGDAAADTPMVDANPSPASTKEKSKKKKDKKKKSSEESEAVDAAADTPMAEPSPASTEKRKNKKSSEEREAVEAVAAAEKEVEKSSKDVAAEKAVEDAATPEGKKRKRNKKHKGTAEPQPVKVTVDVSSAAAAAKAPPVVAYFPSGYNPLAAPEPPSARLFRHTKYPNRVDFVVRSPGGGPDFVGKSYDGEAALPQLCNYALGVLDKASGIIKVVPIASDKILRLEPYFEVQKPAQTQHSGVTQEAGSAVATGEKKVQELTSAYGSKKDKDTDKKWKSLLEQQKDPSAFEDLDFGEPETNAIVGDNQAPVIVRNIPPYNPTADTSEAAYLFDEIIPKTLRSHLLEILGHLESGEFSSKGYGTFVSKRLHKLEKLQGEEKERLAWILSYITHLLTLLARNISMSRRFKKENQSTKAPAVPPAVYRKLLVMFTEEGSSALSTEKKELLINYILVLTLFADDFRSNPDDICADLKMTRAMLRPYYLQLGCKSESSGGAFTAHVWKLPTPLKFPTEVAKRSRTTRR